MENPSTANKKTRKSIGKHSLTMWPECNKEISRAHLACHKRIANTEEVKGSEALPSTSSPH